MICLASLHSTADSVLFHKINRKHSSNFGTWFDRRSGRWNRPHGWGLKSHKQVAGKTTSTIPLGTTEACRGALGVADTGVRQQSGANIFSYTTALELYTKMQPLSVSGCTHHKERRGQAQWVISKIQLVAELPPGMTFEVPSSLYPK